MEADEPLIRSGAGVTVSAWLVLAGPNPPVPATEASIMQLPTLVSVTTPDVLVQTPAPEAEPIEKVGVNKSGIDEVATAFGV
jgi:hypothetical protein